ncbi:hypothetical protein HDU96_006725 [Phlyctochytrium bullatum]|nr:hypothetical protein HDU96_006725 [Phlyctochytrium bullatum]
MSSLHPRSTDRRRAHRDILNRLNDLRAYNSSPFQRPEPTPSASMVISPHTSFGGEHIPTIENGPATLDKAAAAAAAAMAGTVEGMRYAALPDASAFSPKRSVRGSRTGEKGRTDRLERSTQGEPADGGSSKPCVEEFLHLSKATEGLEDPFGGDDGAASNDGSARRSAGSTGAFLLGLEVNHRTPSAPSALLSGLLGSDARNAPNSYRTPQELLLQSPGARTGSSSRRSGQTGRSSQSGASGSGREVGEGRTGGDGSGRKALLDQLLKKERAGSGTGILFAEARDESERGASGLEDGAHPSDGVVPNAKKKAKVKYVPSRYMEALKSAPKRNAETRATPASSTSAAPPAKAKPAPTLRVQKPSSHPAKPLPAAVAAAARKRTNTTANADAIPVSPAPAERVATPKDLAPAAEPAFVSSTAGEEGKASLASLRSLRSLASSDTVGEISGDATVVDVQENMLLVTETRPTPVEDVKLRSASRQETDALPTRRTTSGPSTAAKDSTAPIKRTGGSLTTRPAAAGTVAKSLVEQKPARPPTGTVVTHARQPIGERQVAGSGRKADIVRKAFTTVSREPIRTTENKIGSQRVPNGMHSVSSSGEGSLNGARSTSKQVSKAGIDVPDHASSRSGSTAEDSVVPEMPLPRSSVVATNGKPTTAVRSVAAKATNPSKDLGRRPPSKTPKMTDSTVKKEGVAKKKVRITEAAQVHASARRPVPAKGPRATGSTGETERPARPTAESGGGHAKLNETATSQKTPKVNGTAPPSQAVPEGEPENGAAETGFPAIFGSIESQVGGIFASISDLLRPTEVPDTTEPKGSAPGAAEAHASSSAPSSSGEKESISLPLVSSLVAPPPLPVPPGEAEFAGLSQDDLCLRMEIARAQLAQLRFVKARAAAAFVKRREMAESQIFQAWSFLQNKREFLARLRGELKERQLLKECFEELDVHMEFMEQLMAVFEPFRTTFEEVAKAVEEKAKHVQLKGVVISNASNLQPVIDNVNKILSTLFESRKEDLEKVKQIAKNVRELEQNKATVAALEAQCKRLEGSLEFARDLEESYRVTLDVEEREMRRF